VVDLRQELSHVLWIGGGPQAGKTTLSRQLAGKYDLRIYNLDWHGPREHRERLGPRAAAFGRLSMDERWVHPSVADLVERSIAIWNESFRLVIDDLLALPRSRPILAEGPGAFPWCVAPLVRSPRQAIFLVPNGTVRGRVAERRWGPGQITRFGDTITDLPRALANVGARDAVIDERIVAACAELGLRCERIDGSLDLDASLELIEEHFRPRLPSTVNA
jgi:hypothetical protein